MGLGILDLGSLGSPPMATAVPGRALSSPNTGLLTCLLWDDLSSGRGEGDSFLGFRFLKKKINIYRYRRLIKKCIHTLYKYMQPIGPQRNLTAAGQCRGPLIELGR